MSNGESVDVGTGILIRNRDKQDELQPDFTGSATIDGAQFWIDGHVEVSERYGRKNLRLVFRRKDLRQVRRLNVELDEEDHP